MINIKKNQIIWGIIILVGIIFFTNNLFRNNKYTYVLNKKFYRNMNKYVLDANIINSRLSSREFSSQEELLETLKKEKLKFIPMNYIFQNVIENTNFSVEKLYIPTEAQLENLSKLHGNIYMTQENFIRDLDCKDNNFIQFIQLMKIEKPDIVDYFTHFTLFLAIIFGIKIIFSNYIFKKD